jgi:hypothetical protein
MLRLLPRGCVRIRSRSAAKYLIHSHIVFYYQWVNMIC